LDFDDKKTNVDKLDSFVNPSGEDINGDGKPKPDWKDAKTIINFILDADYDDSKDGGTHGAGYHKGKRDANWLLGDIYHSSPLIIGAPPLNLPDAPFPQKYSKYKEDNKTRETLVYVGANDGMLHAFKDSDGAEKFAIIPKNLLGKLKELRSAHQFYIDSSPRAYDVFFGGSWRTVVMSGERGGGNYYFAVDVTDPSDPKILWEWTDPDGRLGFTWSRPEIGWVRLSGQEKFVAFVGGGYSSTDNVGNTFYVVDIETGTKLRRFDVGDKSNKIPAGATAFDSDLDGRVNGVYFGDINGVLWKIKIDGEEDISKWQLINLYTPGTNSPVFYPPAVTKNNQGKILVYYGQGGELNIFEQLSSNSFFEVWDKGNSGQMIWEEKLAKGEKVLASPAVTDNVVYFTTWLYTGASDNCGAGKGRLYGLTTTSLGTAGDIGALLLDPLTGAEMGSKKKYFEITDYFPKAMGIPSAPIVTNGMIYVSTSLNAGQVITFHTPGWGIGRLKYWREVF
jgi:Tfp pilus tip-associated adhesin PilY1